MNIQAFLKLLSLQSLQCYHVIRELCNQCLGVGDLSSISIADKVQWKIEFTN